MNSSSSSTASTQPTGAAEPLAAEDYLVSNNGDAHPTTGRAGMEDMMLGFAENPAFHGATEGVFQMNTRVRLTRDALGNTQIQILGVDLVSFDPDEATIAREAFEVIQGSALALAVADVSPDILKRAEDGTLRRRSDFLTLHVNT